MQPNDPVVGSTILRRPAIQSPNYSAGSAGWTVNSDGSAEFNNLTVRGTFAGTDFTINASGAFFYSGTPAAGNLVQSIAIADGTDGFGNHYLAGTSTYDSVDGIASQLADGSVTMYSGTLAGGWTSKGSMTITAGGVIVLAATAGVITSNNTLDDGSGNTSITGTACTLTGHASVTAPTAAPSRTNLGSTWNATTASQCNNNFVQIINTLGALGLFT